MPSQPHNPNYQPFDGLEPELPPSDPLERRLLADGARWRTQSAPAVEPFARRVNAALRESVAQADRSVEERPMSQRFVTPPPRVASPPPHSPRHRPGTWGTLVAIAAAVVVVAMLAWVFQAIPHSHLAGKSATPTPSPVPHVTHPRGHWADVLQYTVASANDSIIVAPSDPRVAFRAVSSPSDATATTLTRTDDGGASWTTLALPTDDGGWFGGLAISPLDPQTVFLLLFADQSDPHCPPSALGPGTDLGPAALGAASTTHAAARLGPLHPTSGGYSCAFQYVSRDGGAHWSHPTFPWPGMRLDETGFNSAPVQVQGTTLFAALEGNLNGEAFDGWRLAASGDGGSTWHAADSAIWAAGQIVMSYTAIPGTTTLFARSVPQQTPSGQQSSTTLWRSDDAGAQWSRVGGAAFPSAYAALIGTAQGHAGMTLYALGAQLITQTSAGLTGAGGPPLYTSTDSGRTWSQAPSADEPQNHVASLVGTLADGSLVLAFADQKPFPEAAATNANVSFYAWRPGDKAWFQVTPPPGGGSVTQSWLAAPASGSQTLWIVVHLQGTTYTVRKCVLQ
ncbi:MAG TPA: sialidase family protein [Ktedonobacterales bacterium]|nr:sialidase family protein [Ktedonobacterales bacterium]